jgi:hypothetical protein
MTLPAAFVDRLTAVAGPGAILSDPAALLTYESDALVHLAATPGLVVLPDTPTRQAIVRALPRVPGAVRRARAAARDSRAGRCRFPTACS